jgi:hypothetical protein
MAVSTSDWIIYVRFPAGEECADMQTDSGVHKFIYPMRFFREADSPERGSDRG